jgi:hypothetical protein
LYVDLNDNTQEPWLIIFIVLQSIDADSIGTQSIGTESIDTERIGTEDHEVELPGIDLRYARYDDAAEQDISGNGRQIRERA